MDQETNELIEKISDAVIARIKSKGLPTQVKGPGLNIDETKGLAKMIDQAKRKGR